MTATTASKLWKGLFLQRI